MDVSSVSNIPTNIDSLLLSGLNKVERTRNGYDPTGKTANYAQKGEPMYIADMDTDGDGTVTLDEFRDYCKSKNISSRDMMNMSKLASAYRTLKSENETIDYISKLTPNVFPKLKQSDSSSTNKVQSENKYNLSTDADNAKNVSYKEYLKYCKENTAQPEFQTGTKVEETTNGNIKITNFGKAMNLYKNSDTSILKNTFEERV